MNTDTIEHEGLRHFGRISASVSHEIKNVLAVINESAGLMDDLALMAEKGMPVTPDKIRRATGTIIDQVRRGDTIIKNINTFAHSIDHDVREVDPADIMALVSALSRRFAANNNTTLKLGESAPATIRTAPFALQHLLQLCLDRAMENAPSGSVLTLASRPAEDGIELTVTGAGPDAAAASTTAPLMQALEHMLGARVRFDSETGVIALRLPKRLPEGKA